MTCAERSKRQPDPMTLHRRSLSVNAEQFIQRWFRAEIAIGDHGRAAWRLLLLDRPG